jgi:class 3 adenylate cyclase
MCLKVVKAAQLTALAHGGQIIASSSLFGALKNGHQALKELVTVKALGKVELTDGSTHSTCLISL